MAGSGLVVRFPHRTAPAYRASPAHRCGVFAFSEWRPPLLRFDDDAIAARLGDLEHPCGLGLGRCLVDGVDDAELSAQLRRNAGLPTSCSLVPEGAPMTEDLVRALQDRRLRLFRSDGINGRIVGINPPMRSELHVQYALHCKEADSPRQPAVGRSHSAGLEGRLDCDCCRWRSSHLQREMLNSLCLST